jgi:hypothetical protein
LRISAYTEKKHQDYFFYIFVKFFSYQSPTSILGISMVFVLTAIMSTTGRLILTLMISWDLYKGVWKTEHYGKASNPPIKDDSFPVGNQHYDPCHQPLRCLPASPGWKSVL